MKLLYPATSYRSLYFWGFSFEEDQLLLLWQYLTALFSLIVRSHERHLLVLCHSQDQEGQNLCAFCSENVKKTSGGFLGCCPIYLLLWRSILSSHFVNDILLFADEPAVGRKHFCRRLKRAV